MAITEDPTQLTHADLPELLKNDISVKVGGTDIDGQVRGKLMSKKKFLSIAQSGFGFCSVVFGWDMHDQTYFKELKISNAENGYRDILAEVDLSSFRWIPWENNVPFFLCSFREPEGQSLSACPRSLLERQCDKLAANGMGALAGGKSGITILTLLPMQRQASHLVVFNNPLSDSLADQASFPSRIRILHLPRPAGTPR